MSLSGTPSAARWRTIVPKSARLAAIDFPGEEHHLDSHEPRGCAGRNYAPAAVAHIDVHVAVPIRDLGAFYEDGLDGFEQPQLVTLRPLASHDARALQSLNR
jgi:hypothetical protein